MKIRTFLCRMLPLSGLSTMHHHREASRTKGIMVVASLELRILLWRHQLSHTILLAPKTQGYNFQTRFQASASSSRPSLPPLHRPLRSYKKNWKWTRLGRFSNERAALHPWSPRWATLLYWPHHFLKTIRLYRVSFCPKRPSIHLDRALDLLRAWLSLAVATPQII